MFIVNVEGAIFKEDQWLIIKRSDLEDHAAGLLSFVGGKAEDEGNSDDILEKTVRREIFEEVGVTIKEKIYYINSSSFIADDGVRVINVVFLCEYESGEPIAKSSDEVAAVSWMNCEEIKRHSDSPSWFIANLEKAEDFRTQLNKNRRI